MKELKFRAWDKKRNRYVGDGEIVFKHYGSEAAVVVCPNSQDYIGDICHDEYTDDGRFVVEQYTGLKDRNGKEIYEGDIVRYLYYTFYDGKEDWREVPVKCGIMLDGEGYVHGAFQTYGTVINNVQYEEYGECIKGDSLIDVAHKCEVIGNIHENPELIGDEE